MCNILRTLSALLPALLMGACAAAPAPRVPVPGTPAPHFDPQIASFEAQDLRNPPPQCATLFVGSSTIVMWSTLKQDFPTRTVINRGFGGSTLWEVDDYFSRVVAPYHPAQIVIYAGENDIASNPPRTPQQVYADFETFMALKDQALGSTPVWFISLKPTKLRWSLREQMTEVNGKVRALAAQRRDLGFIDVAPAMLNADGSPKDIYRADGLHMTPEGYELWAPLVNRALDKGLPARAPECHP